MKSHGPRNAGAEHSGSESVKVPPWQTVVVVAGLLLALMWSRQTRLENELSGLRGVARTRGVLRVAAVPGGTESNSREVSIASQDAPEAAAPQANAANLTPADRLLELEETLQAQADAMEDLLAKLAQQEERARKASQVEPAGLKSFFGSGRSNNWALELDDMATVVPTIETAEKAKNWQPLVRPKP
jgi:hypothetical protein